MYSCCILACVRARVCDCVCFCLWVHVCVRARAHVSRGLSDLGPSIIWFFTRLSFHQFSLSVGPKHPNYSDESAPRSWIHNLGALRIILLVFLLMIIALVVPCTLLKHPTSHALFTSPSPKRVRLLGVHRHRTGWRLVGRTLRFTF